MERYLKYQTEPQEWMEGLPIGNGRLAAMVQSFGKCDKLSLNNEFLYTGEYRDRDIENTSHFLPYVREYLKKGDYFRGKMLANVAFAGLGGVSGLPGRVDPYQPAGDLYIEFDSESKLLERKLDIFTGLCTAERMAEAKISAKTVCDCKNDLIFYIAESDAPFSAWVKYERIFDEKANTKTEYSADSFVFECNFEKSAFKVIGKLFTDGQTENKIDGIAIKNATILKIAVDIISEEDTQKSLCEPTDGMFLEHCTYFEERMSDFEFSLVKKENDEYTDVRIEKYKSGAKDTGLEELFVNYGRYLLLSCSICGKYPANLQGKWNDRLNPPWKSDFHHDINLQMCYWLAEKCNMSDCAKLLSDFALKMMENSERLQIPQKLFGCRGTYIPLSTDGWAIPTPESFGWAVWVGAAAWIAQHLWWHYTYSGDKEYLKNDAYRYFKSVALFFEDFLEEDENGILQIIPSQSPENGFKEGGKGTEVTLCISSSFDVQLVRDVLYYCIESAKVLNVDCDKIALWQDMVARLPKPQIASDGRLVEWDKEDYTETQPGHRHLSHLYGIFPGEQFTPEKNRAFYDAGIKTLDFRMSHEGVMGGWSHSWCSNIYARVKNTEKFYEHFSLIIKEFSTVSLLDMYPPSIFQLDGNMGGASAAIEAVATYYDEKLHLLNTLPENWESGRIKNFKTPGGHKIDFCWENGRITSLKAEIGYGEKLVIAPCKGLEEGIVLTGKKGEVVTVNSEEKV